MPSRSPHPEISIGIGRTQVVLRGRDAIRAAGWSLRFLLFARGAFLFFVAGTLSAYAAMKWWLSVVP
jgi:hypothetical protein